MDEVEEYLEQLNNKKSYTVAELMDRYFHMKIVKLEVRADLLETAMIDLERALKRSKKER